MGAGPPPGVPRPGPPRRPSLGESGLPGGLPASQAVSGSAPGFCLRSLLDLASVGLGGGRNRGLVAKKKTRGTKSKNPFWEKMVAINGQPRVVKKTLEKQFGRLIPPLGPFFSLPRVSGVWPPPGARDRAAPRGGGGRCSPLPLPASRGAPSPPAGKPPLGAFFPVALALWLGALSSGPAPIIMVEWAVGIGWEDLEECGGLGTKIGTLWKDLEILGPLIPGPGGGACSLSRVLPGSAVGRTGPGDSP